MDNGKNNLESLVKKGQNELDNGGLSKKLACMISDEDDLVVSEMNPKVWKEAVEKCKMGTKIEHSKGYVLVYDPKHPFCNKNKYVFEHRLVLEKHLRETDPSHRSLIKVDGELYLRKTWLPHHKNEDKKDNNIDNLEPKTVKMHRRKHMNGAANPMYKKRS